VPNPDLPQKLVRNPDLAELLGGKMRNPDLERVRNPDFTAKAKSGLRTYSQVRNPDFTPRSPGYGLTARCVTRTWPEVPNPDLRSPGYAPGCF